MSKKGEKRMEKRKGGETRRTEGKRIEKGKQECEWRGEY